MLTLLSGYMKWLVPIFQVAPVYGRGVDREVQARGDFDHKRGRMQTEDMDRKLIKV